MKIVIGAPEEICEVCGGQTAIAPPELLETFPIEEVREAFRRRVCDCPMEDQPMTTCPHTTVKCLCCGEEATPAQFMGKAKKTMTPEAREQRSKAARARWSKKKEKAPD